MRLGILTDIHLSPPGSPPAAWYNPYQFDTVRERLAQAIRFLEVEGVDRFAVLGDLTHHGDEPSLQEAIAILATANVPVWILPGNHDLTSGITPFTGAIDAAGGGTVIAIGSEPVPLDSAWRVAGLPIERNRDGGGFMASPAPEPDSWGDGPVLLLSHFPVLSLQQPCANANLKYAGDLHNAGHVATSLVDRAAPTLVINGHLHIRHTDVRGSVLQAACGAQVESLFEATVIDIRMWEDGRVTWNATPIQPVWPGVSPALAESAQAWTWDGVGWRS